MVGSQRQRLSRRRVVLGGVAAAVASAAGVAAWRLGGSGEHAQPASPATPSPAPTNAPSPTPLPRGGVARLASPARFNFDTFDVIRSGEPSVVEVLGRTHSRLLQWADFEAPAIEGDLARAWEQPDPTTWVFHLHEAARWHDISPVNGRPVTAADVAAHFSRALEAARGGQQPAVQRPTDLLVVRRVTAPDARRVVFETVRPDPFLTTTIAGRFALIQAPEAVAAFEGRWHEQRPEQVIGSGPFGYLGPDGDGTLRFRAHTASHRPPLLDGADISEPYGVASRFRERRLDEALTRDRRYAALLRTEAPGAVELARFEDSPVISTLFAGAPPWSNADLRRALSAALNRTVLAQRLFGARAAASGPVAPVFPAFALTESELARYPGYNPDPATDARQGRALWEAAGGPALGTVTVDFPAIFDPLYSASSVVAGMLNETLGAQFRAAIESYPTISAKAVAHRYGAGNAALWFGWGPAFVDPDPSRFLNETYGSTGPGFATLGYGSGNVDRALGALMSEFEVSRRDELSKEIARLLLAEGGGGVFDWLVQRSEVFRWPRFHAAAPSPFWAQHQADGAYLDTAAPAST